MVINMSDIKKELQALAIKIGNLPDEISLLVVEIEDELQAIIDKMDDDMVCVPIRDLKALKKFLHQSVSEVDDCAIIVTEMIELKRSNSNE